MSTRWINDDGTTRLGSGWTETKGWGLSSSSFASTNLPCAAGYDDENQLISVYNTNTWRNDFVYDGKMRRRIELDYTWNAGTSGWQQTNEIHFVYDGNLVIQERDINNQPQVTYTRGNDLSGQTGSALNGAGGIGGLLARSDRNQVIPGLVTSGGVSEFGTHSYYHADGNGNVTMLIAASQMIVAKYLYDPFGNTLAKCGLLADVNNYGFSSKEWNGNSGLYYYQYRFFDPNLQRWVNRDPLGERGGFNVYEFLENNPVVTIDFLGLAPGYGNPVSGPNGPVGPSGPYIPPMYIPPLVPRNPKQPTSWPVMPIIPPYMHTPTCTDSGLWQSPGNGPVIFDAPGQIGGKAASPIYGGTTNNGGIVY
jgi:RHS repeat-associated protein